MQEEETEAKRPRVKDEPQNSINSDIDMDEQLNKLKMQNWSFMSMVKGYEFRRAKDRQQFMRELDERQPDAERSDELYDQSLQEASGGEVFVHVQDPVGVSGAVRMIQNVRELG